jgi:DNA polymerase
MPRTALPTAAPLVPARPTLPTLREAARSCQACPLWQTGTQTVFGEGEPGARLVLVGEQPGDAEDRAGRPFVGPAGRLLDKLLEAAAIDRRAVYVTNAVKHFKWTAQGKRRIHAKPSAAEVTACRPWLDAEIATLAPHAIVCLGATAAQALLGRAFRVTQQRGEWIPSPLAPHVMATWHPSAILRAPDEASRRAGEAELLADLQKVRAVL